jgi:hypothetical protein
LDAGARGTRLAPQHVPEGCRHVWSRWAAVLESVPDRTFLPPDRVKWPGWGPAYLRPMFRDARSLRGYGGLQDSELRLRYREGLCPVAEALVPRLVVLDVSSQIPVREHVERLCRFLDDLEQARG